MFEGMAQGGLGSNWGDGHVTDVDLLSLRVSSNADPNPFYRQLVNAPYANNAIISAHVYPCVSPPPPPAVSEQSDEQTGSNSANVQSVQQHTSSTVVQCM